jgi:tetratricopeptide (TPR) repeat protein
MKSSPIFAIVALFGWIPLVLALFALLPARRAVVAGSIAAWLLLPPIGIDFPGFPNYTKATAATVGVLLGTFLFEPNRLLCFRLRWFDVPMLLWCLCPFLSSVTNELGVYDALSATFRQMVAWLLPYLVGRLYLTDLEGLRELALGMVIGGVCLAPLCLFEVRMSPQLLQKVYGLGNWEGAMRFGAYRPRVFFGSGIELGLWMNAVTLVAWWLWRTTQLKRLGGVPGGAIFAGLLVTTILCRATSAMVLCLAGFCALWVCWRTKTKWVMWGLLFTAPIYCAVRIGDLWSGSHAVSLARRFLNEDRAHSLEYRLVNEDLLIAKALQRPIFGWGGWGRNLVYNDDGRQLAEGDGLWIVTFGLYGYVGLVLMTVVLLLPAMLFLRRFRVELWDQPGLAPAAAIAIIVNLVLLDGLINGMLNVIYIIAAGGLANIIPSHTRPRAKTDRLSVDSRESTAVRYLALGRALKDQGQFTKAKTAWLHSLDLLSEQTAARPDLPALHHQWCDCANDLAWFLANAPDPTVRDPVYAHSLAATTTAAYPESTTYWNTLGAASYRTGDLQSAVTALHRAIALSDGGTAFDHFFLAMAHARLGNEEEARRWFTQAQRWMEHCHLDHTELLNLRDEARSMLPEVPNPAVVAH